MPRSPEFVAVGAVGLDLSRVRPGGSRQQRCVRPEFNLHEDRDTSTQQENPRLSEGLLLGYLDSNQEQEIRIRKFVNAAEGPKFRVFSRILDMPSYVLLLADTD
jgi:hypothetical protein